MSGSDSLDAPGQADAGPPGSAAGYFGGMVDAYDSLIRRAVPRYEEITAALIGYLPTSVDRGLELGCGTGNLSLRLARRYPAAHFTFLDAAPEMTGLTEARLRSSEGDVDRFAFQVTRFEELPEPRTRFDLVTSSFSLHHVLDKGALFREIRGRMAPRGRLCFADQLRGAPDSVHQKNWSDWLAFCRQPGHCTDEEIRSLIEHSEAHDHYVTVAEHFRLLQDAGFREMDCVWRGGMWGILTATAA